MIKEIVDHMKVEEEHFEVRLIINGLKILGKKHVNEMIKNILECQKYENLISGFDLVNEEDFSPQILEYIDSILKGKSLDKKYQLPCFFHAGETHDRGNHNLYDAILLNSKRIGHGL